MCVIVHLEPKKTISKEQLRSCFTANRDGWGIMWAKHDKVHAVKDKSDFDDFYNIWKQVPHDVTRALHFRIRTAGEINKSNCHPFQVTDDVWMMHNGSINAMMMDDKMSDTWNFVVNELRPIVKKWPNFMQSKVFNKLMEDVTGYSKLLFLNSQGEVLKVRNGVWVERQGIHYSNGHSLLNNYSSGIYSNGYYEDGVWHSGSRHAHTHNRTNSNALTTRNQNFYSSLKDRIAQVDEADEQFKDAAVVSDLYSGNKTDEEGQLYLEEMERQRIEEIEASRSADDLPEQEDIDDEVRDEDDITLTPSTQDVCNWSDQSTIEWIQDNPRSATLFIQGLLETLIQFKALDAADAFIGREITKREATG